MKTVEQKIIKFTDRESLIVNGDRVITALSGGPDSVLLLHFLKKYASRFKIEIIACHINHNLRGADSDSDQQFCEKLCNLLDVKLYVKSCDVKTYAAENKISIEEAARDIRYSELNKLAEEKGFTKIATAHNKDDNSETMLLNLFKGTGLKGLSGIPVKRGNIIRPMLCLEKAEVIGYLNENKIEYRIDKTNNENDFQRNFIRNSIIPQIKEKINPSLDDALLNSAQVIKSSAGVLSKYASKISEQYSVATNDTLEIKLELLKQEGDDIFGEVLKYQLDKVFGHSFNFDDYLKLKELTGHQTGKKVVLSKKLEAYRERGAIIFVKAQLADETINETLRPGNEVKVDDITYGIEIASGSFNLDSKDDNRIEYICADELNEEFTLRRWEHGDKFIPLGMNNHKKVSDFLNEQHVPAYQKKNKLVLTNRNEIVWITGLRIDDRFKLNENCKKVYKLWMK